jgi:hypothetical protein
MEENIQPSTEKRLEAAEKQYAQNDDDGDDDDLNQAHDANPLVVMTKSRKPKGVRTSHILRATRPAVNG